MKGGKESRIINFRPVLFCAVGLICGISLAVGLRIGKPAPAAFCLPVLLVLCALFPFSRKKCALILFCVIFFFGTGALAATLYQNAYFDALPAGSYRMTGTVVSVARKRGYSIVELGDLSSDGKRVGGRMGLILSGTGLCPSDVITITVSLTPIDEAQLSEDPSVYSLFAENVRYSARTDAFERTGISSNPLLRLKGALYRSLNAHMEQDTADVCFALLTGDASSMDSGLYDGIRRGGIAHIFAVSGLHIGILYGAAYLLFRPLGKLRFLPALLIAFLYSGVCGFSVSSLRAVIMCGVLSVNRAFGRKQDLLSSLSFAALAVLLLMPAQWYAVGMRLSFGACLGIALFAGTFTRALRRLKLPAPIAGYLAVMGGVNLLTAPILLASFGYFSVWGFLTNLVFIPLLPVLFLGALLSALLALIIPPAAAFFLALPAGEVSLFLYLMSLSDFSFVVSGFALGAGGGVWLLGCVFLSERVRMTRLVRSFAAIGLALLFSVTVFLENLVWGTRIDVLKADSGYAALFRTGKESVLVIDGSITAADCEKFLMRTYGGRLDGIVILSEEELDGIGTAMLLNGETLFARDEIETGLHQAKISFGDRFSVGGLTFRYESRDRLYVLSEGLAVEICYEQERIGEPLLDFFRSGTYFLKDGVVKRA